MKFKFIFLPVLMLAAACGTEQPKVEEVTTPSVDTVQSTQAPKTVSAGLSVYQNQEIVSYCTLIPDEYEENTEASVKAGHAFIHNKNENHEIEVKGLLRANTEVTAEQYMAGSLEDAALEGKVIETKELLKDKNCFYLKGYWNNTINESRFIEICWLRRDDVVKYYASFAIADTTLWNGRLKEIVDFGSSCE